jgi:hypothetical protein
MGMIYCFYGLSLVVTEGYGGPSRLLKKGFVGKGEGNRDVNSGYIHRNLKT